MRIAELAGALGARIVGGEGAEAREVERAAGLEDAGPGALTFYANPRYRARLLETRATAVLLDEAAARSLPDGFEPIRLLVDNPYAAYARALALLHPRVRPAPGIHPSAMVDPEAHVDPSAHVGALAYVGPGAEIGPGTVLHPQVHVGREVRIGAECELYPHAVVLDGCVLGRRVVLQAGAIVGGDGFGYALDTEEGRPIHRKVPQVGIVRIEDDVEIGAGACIDRATTGETVVGRGTKIDNLVQVGHNVRIGPASILCGQTGIAGSAKIGAGVVLAGQVGVVGHLTVGDGARVGAKAGVHNDVAEGETVTGYPAWPQATWLRAMAALKTLPSLVKRVRRLEREREARS
ncbi:MAG: UDP-3-O-(3-hydroxymyristoyl)glucosamine N-acyltransferase [Deltaproteobacteria bacterium]|nr:MAG: UDP-3-O-(3-hydroxymyristoyl)glucosamine N-acyltransferase [Deltaproteobacteria bacterium]